jgi:hypothetical protein
MLLASPGIHKPSNSEPVIYWLSVVWMLGPTIQKPVIIGSRVPFWVDKTEDLNTRLVLFSNGCNQFIIQLFLCI